MWPCLIECAAQALNLYQATRDDGLPPLDEYLSAMDERIEFLSSALSSLSEELSAKSKPGAGGASPVAGELARVKAQLKEAEARAASSRQAAPPSGASDLARVEAELSALKSENAALKAAAAAAPAAAGAGGDVAELKAKLEAAERENAALKGQLKQKDQEIDDLNTAARVAASCVTASRPHSRSPLAAQPRFLQPLCTRHPAPPLRRIASLSHASHIGLAQNHAPSCSQVLEAQSAARADDRSGLDPEDARKPRGLLVYRSSEWPYARNSCTHRL